MPRRSNSGSARLALACALAAISLSAHTLVVDQRHAAANDANAGTAAAPLASINRAAQLAVPGDIVLVHAGVYRERVAPARGGLPGQPITYMAVPGERVSIRGSDVFKPVWRPVKGARDLYTARLRMPALLVYNPFAISAKAGSNIPGTLGQVFVDGCELPEASRLADVRAAEGRWMVWNHMLLVHFPHAVRPEKAQVEISVRRRVFAPLKRGLGYIVVRGFIIEHCANPYPIDFWASTTPQQGALGTRAGHHWVIEDNVVRHAKTIGVDIGSEGEHDSDGRGQPVPEVVGYHVIRHNVVSDNGVSGIAGWNQRGTRVQGNIVERNGTLHTNFYEEAGVKIHVMRDGVVEGNLVRDNETRGIWMDNQNVGSRVTRNVLYNNRSEGVFVELESGPVQVDRNVICCSRKSGDADQRADGYYMHDASGILIERNLIFDNDGFGIDMRVVTDRPLDMPTGLVEASDNRIRSNVIVQNRAGALAIPASGPRSRDNFSDDNLFDPDALFVRLGPAAGETETVAIGGWRILTSFDEHSATAGARVRLLRGASMVELETPQALGPAVGPFPSLAPGTNKIRVWPVDGIGGPPAGFETAPGCAAASNQ